MHVTDDTVDVALTVIMTYWPFSCLY